MGRVFLLSAVVLFSSVTACRDTAIDLGAQIVGHWEGNLVRQGKSWAVSLDLWLENGHLCGSADARDQGRYGLELEQLKFSGNKFSFEIGSGDGAVLCYGEVAGKELTGTFEGMGIEAALHMTRQSGEPVRVREEPVTIQAEGATLAGTLILPAKAGKYSGIVLGHGSGQWLRSMSSYRSRAVLFARNGVASFIYDRRGKGQSSGDTTRILPIATLAGDLLAGVEFLKSRDDIHPERIGVYGLSQSGWAAPLAASLSPDVAFVMAISPPGISPDEQDQFVIDKLVEEHLDKALPDDIPMGVRENILAQSQIDRTANAIKQGRDSIEVVPGVSRFDPVPVWQQVKVPVLCLWGELDRLVPAELSRASIAGALHKGGNSETSLRIIPGVSHTLQIVRRRDSEWDWERQAPGVDQELVSWLNAHAGATNEGGAD